MRRAFSQKLKTMMEEDPDLYVVTADLGYGMFDIIRDTFPKRFINVGSAEMLMILTATGLSLSGKNVITYTITPFYWRAAEAIRNYCNHEQIPVLMVGSGRDNDYAHDGFSHWAGDDESLFQKALNINTIKPNTIEEMSEFLDNYYWDHPCYLNLKR